jgi:hypothetical protein
MSWSGLASNQMVTFTDAQTSPFTLNSGQSSVTSNECMTKSQALTKYNLDASAMSAYANNQLVPKSVWVSGVTYTQIFGWKYNPCSSDATIYEGSDGLYYTDTTGTLLNATIYIYAGPDGDFDYFWSEIPYTDGVAGFANIISSFCGPS